MRSSTPLICAASPRLSLAVARQSSLSDQGKKLDGDDIKQNIVEAKKEPNFVTKQLLIYERVVPLANDTHSDVSIADDNRYQFARKLNSAPLLAIEFLHAALDHPIVFAKNGDNIFPAAILGLRPDRNENLTHDGHWNDSYIPAFFRRYPFVFTNDEASEDNNFILAIDEAAPGLNRNGDGQALFDSSGNRTPYLQNRLDFTAEYQRQYHQTRALCIHLQNLGLLEDYTAHFTYWSGRPGSLTGFNIINRERLSSLSKLDTSDLLEKGVLEILFSHLASLSHLERLSAFASREGGSQLKPRALQVTAELLPEALHLKSQLESISTHSPLVAHSRKISAGFASESRVLLTINKKDLKPGTDLSAIASIIGTAAPQELIQYWDLAQCVHLGLDFEDPLRGSVKKLYLEFPLDRTPEENLVYIAVKVGNAELLHRYERISDPSDLIEALCGSQDLRTVAKVIAEHSTFLLKVSESGSDRLSLDMNLADSSPTPRVEEAIDRLIQLIDPLAERSRHWPSHVALGRSASGSLFVTLYGWPSADCP